jgi:hypothetical protein
MRLPPVSRSSAENTCEGEGGAERVLKDVVLMPLAWSVDVAYSSKWEWWGHQYASNLRSGKCRPETIDCDEMRRRCGKPHRDASATDVPRRRFAASLPVARPKK